MKIGSRIKDKHANERKVHIHGKLYVFKPLEDNAGESHLVADVHDEKHAVVLLQNDAFYAFGADKEKTSTLKAGGGKTAAPVTNPVEHTAEDLEAAALLLKGSAGEIGKALSNSTASIIKAAIDVEGANASPRKTVVTLLTNTLDYMQQAKV